MPGRERMSLSIATAREEDVSDICGITPSSEDCDTKMYGGFESMFVRQFWSCLADMVGAEEVDKSWMLIISSTTFRLD